MPTDPPRFQVPTELLTGRLRLRLPSAADGAAVSALVRATLAELRPWMPWATDDYDVAAGEAWCAAAAAGAAAGGQAQFLVLLRATDAHIGNVGLHDLALPGRPAEIGYWLGTPFVGRGYVTEAVRAVTDLALVTRCVGRVTIRTDPANGRSRRVAERCGYALDPTASSPHECVYARTLGLPAA